MLNQFGNIALHKINHTFRLIIFEKMYFFEFFIFAVIMLESVAQNENNSSWTCAHECIFEKPFESGPQNSIANNTLTRRLKRQATASDALKKLKELKESLIHFCGADSEQWLGCFKDCPDSDFKSEFVQHVTEFKGLVCDDVNDALDKLACIATSVEFKRCVSETCGDEYLELGKTIMRYMLDEKKAIPGEKVCKVDDCVNSCSSKELPKVCGDESQRIFESSNRIEQLAMILLLFKEEPKLENGRYCGDIPI